MTSKEPLIQLSNEQLTSLEKKLTEMTLTGVEALISGDGKKLHAIFIRQKMIKEGYLSPNGYPVGIYRVIEEKLTQQEAETLVKKLQGIE